RFQGGVFAVGARSGCAATSTIGARFTTLAPRNKTTCRAKRGTKFMGTPRSGTADHRHKPGGREKEGCTERTAPLRGIEPAGRGLAWDPARRSSSRPIAEGRSAAL